MDNSRNLLLAFLLSGLLIFGWDAGMRYFYPQPETTEESASVDGAAPAAQTSAGGVAGTSTVAADIDGATPDAGPVDLSAALADPQRVVIDAPRIAGSINLVGARVDDIVLKDHRQTVKKDSGPVRLFAPERTEDQYFAEFGFIIGGRRLPDTLVWEADGAKLTPQTPVTLSAVDGEGITYSIKLTVDDGYMITAEQSVTNSSGDAEIVQPFAFVKRTDRTATPWEWLVHSGPTGVFGGVVDYDQDYETLAETGKVTGDGAPSWLGFSDRYWLSALVPGDGKGTTNAEGAFRSLGDTLFRADVLYEAQTLASGSTLTQQTRLFAGAKESVVLDDYEESGITLFGKAISWGWFEIIEKPLLWLLRQLNSLIGNFGVAIIALTFIIRGLMFPIAQKQFSSMAQMKALQPKMKAIQERYKDDRQVQQQKIMELYKEEKANPLAGCLPLLLQIPIFFALYKVLILSIEMRHEPFLYISDLTAPDPATILNLFGLLPFEVTGFLGIGVLAILLGFTMWLTFRLNPSAMDPVQQQIFNLMPWILMFVMASFASGLLLYWVTSNVLTLAQQSYLYSKNPQLKAAAEKEKAEQAKKKAQEDAEKSEA
ncbi:MAG: membrane protein insertase YidC [Pseudomonadota bacterium]|nr:membrane protein insertase YidC [Pseudomonadota bacterium]